MRNAYTSFCLRVIATMSVIAHYRQISRLVDDFIYRQEAAEGKK